MEGVRQVVPEHCHYHNTEYYFQSLRVVTLWLSTSNQLNDAETKTSTKTGLGYKTCHDGTKNQESQHLIYN